MLVLASNSPRRKQLLALGGWDFTVVAPQVDERVLPGETPQVYVRRLAESKARAARHVLAGDAFALVGMNKSHWQETIILAADTTVVYQAAPNKHYEILGKPADADEAEAMLRRLRGQVHQVFTGLAVLRIPGEELQSEVIATDVRMRDYSDEEMLAYIATSDPLDKAGAYAIQHPGFRPVQNLQGCYANVMGLPVCNAAGLLTRFGCPPASEVVQGCQQALEFTCPVFLKAIAKVD
jgi:septum formation protein